MHEYNIKDYSGFSSAISTTKTLSSKIQSLKSSLAEVKSTISNSAVFMGPAADKCVQELSSIDLKCDEMINNLSSISSYLSQTESSYKSGDSSAKDLVLSTGSASSSSSSSSSSGTTTSGSSKTTGAAKSSSSTINSAIDWAVGIANDNSHGYSQNTRWGNPNYDCSSLVISAYENAGIKVKEAGASYTGNMKKAFQKAGFEWIPGDPKKTGLELKPGDVLLKENNHTEMYVGNGKNVGAHSNYDGKNGDSSGKEINVQASNHAWDGVLRLKQQ